MMKVCAPSPGIACDWCIPSLFSGHEINLLPGMKEAVLPPYLHLSHCTVPIGFPSEPSISDRKSNTVFRLKGNPTAVC